ncbi:SET domain-containing protein [Christiangramia sabulilitoris]|uniref:SET domain-containing protein n=1 Tax=Christiangramia sabulilitoris TaxID=2583991 RepID=A0A550I0D9_9FLAO|nr:SET domain-containing protein [Christiangramia sabulilitoris]TRO64446.1 SET domain-containing protein [Christiangramia sabulilitoris]
MMHPDTSVKWINASKGIGVIATSFIPKGTITWVQDELDILFHPEKAEKLNPYTAELFEKFSFRNNKGEYILCWDIAKYVNHSFRSNCLSTGYNFEVAIRDIQVGEELTDDYGYLNLTEAFVPEDEGTERKIVKPDDITVYYADWDAILEPIFPEILKQKQALLTLLPKDVLQEIHQVSAGQKKMLSTKNLYYDPSLIGF